MYRYTTLMLSLCLVLATWIRAQPQPDSYANRKADVMEILVTSLEVGDKILKLGYEIRNEANYDTWILVGFGRSDSSAEAFMDKDGRTILIRRRFDVPFGGGGLPVYGRYVRMRPGQVRTEFVSLVTPVRPERQFASAREAKGLEFATRLAIEIGFYSGDLPCMIHGLIEEVEKRYHINRDDDDDELTQLGYFFGGLLKFNQLNEGLRQRDEEILIPFTDQVLKGEQVVRAEIDGLLIPYEEKDDLSQPHFDLAPCTRIDIKYQPSVLEYFFPYEGQQSLLNKVEKQSLLAIDAVVIEDQEELTTFANDVDDRVRTNGLTRQRGIAEVVCYRDDERLNSFTICDDESIVTEANQKFSCQHGFPSLRMFTPQIQLYELRMRCAANLKDIWHRLRLYPHAERKRLGDLIGESQIVSPPMVDEWCDAMERAYSSTGIYDESVTKPHICPGAEEGRNHYAINPNCKPDSPPDMVLLFETKAGWNQHGGPEIFTFDNHDPKGGCVLLNDGTVKFIRTEEELQQLRWK